MRQGATTTATGASPDCATSSPGTGARVRLGEAQVGGAPIDEDLRRVETAIDVAGAADRVAVDANWRLDTETAVELGKALLPLGLMRYEEPVDPLDYDAHAQVAASNPGVLATGENLFSVQDVRNLVRYGGLRPGRDVLQMDLVLSYGLTEYLRMLDAIEAAGWSRDPCTPHSGHLLNLLVASPKPPNGTPTPGWRPSSLA
jgi:L-alanine-DL-glutamate epimerase-like enolase superfamily enzyme